VSGLRECEKEREQRVPSSNPAPSIFPCLEPLNQTRMMKKYMAGHMACEKHCRMVPANCISRPHYSFCRFIHNADCW